MNPARSYTLLTCSGVSNTGRLTTQAASVLIGRDPDRFECHLTAKQATQDLLRELEGTDCLVIVDGCSDQCAAKKLRGSRIEPDIHIIATDYGIKKNGLTSVQFQEIEQLIQAIIQSVEGNDLL